MFFNGDMFKADPADAGRIRFAWGCAENGDVLLFLQVSDEILRRIQQEPRAGFNELFAAAEPPEDTEGLHTRGGGAGHVCTGVAQIGEVGGRNAERSGDGQRSRGIRLEGNCVELAAHDGERIPREIMTYHAGRVRVRLVGEDRARYSAGTQFIEKLRDTGVWSGEHPGMSFVLMLVGAVDLIEHILPIPDGALREDAGPVAHEISVVVHIPDGEAVEGEGIVHGGSYVIQSVDKGAVEIEDDCFYFLAHNYLPG